MNFDIISKLAKYQTKLAREKRTYGSLGQVAGIDPNRSVRKFYKAVI